MFKILVATHFVKRNNGVIDYLPTTKTSYRMYCVIIKPICTIEIGILNWSIALENLKKTDV